MGSLFQSLTDLPSARAAAMLTEAICKDAYDECRTLCQAIEKGEVHVPLADISPDVGSHYSPSYILVFCSGTENWMQLLGAYVGITQTTVPGVAGKVFGEFGRQAMAIKDAIGASVEPLLADRTLVLMGHSRGGAVAQILAAIWGPSAKACYCYSFGSPRAGNHDFVDSIAPYVVRYENVEDSVVIVPFNDPKARLLPWYRRWFHSVNPDGWDDAGLQRSLDYAGNVTDDGPRAGNMDFYRQLTSAAFPFHQMEVYRSRLTRSSPDPFGRDQVVDPPTMNATAESQSVNDGQLFSSNAHIGQGETVALCAGSMYFKSLDRTFGWTETWYATLGVSAMLDAIRGLTNQRLAFLAVDCGIYWYGARIVEKGAPRSSTLFKRTKIAKGTASPTGTYAGDATAMTMDCIVGRLVGSSGSVRQEKWRGLPDEYLQGDGLSSAGVGALDIINSYLLAVKGAGLGIRRQTMVDADKKDIDGIVKAANGNVNLTVTAHGILLDNAFEVVVRGRNLGNQMLRAKWNAKVIDVNTIQLLNSTNFGVGTGGPGGTLTVTAYNADSIVNPPAQSKLFDFNQTSTIKTGRPSDLHHGKRSPVVRHR